MKLEDFGQYKNDIFKKLNFEFAPQKKILDVGCGNGSDSKIFSEIYDLETYGTDIYEHPDISNNSKLKFLKGSIFELPFESDSFDYIFLHDVLHHIDEPFQRKDMHTQGLVELNRVLKKDGHIIIVEGNRYNPLFYPHMVKMLGHDHFTQSYFKRLILETFPNVEFKFFESHLYPVKFLKFFKIFESVMESYMPDAIKAYNVALIKGKSNVAAIKK